MRDISLSISSTSSDPHDGYDGVDNAVQYGWHHPFSVTMSICLLSQSNFQLFASYQKDCFARLCFSEKHWHSNEWKVALKRSRIRK